MQLIFLIHYEITSNSVCGVCVCVCSRNPFGSSVFRGICFKWFFFEQMCISDEVSTNWGTKQNENKQNRRSKSFYDIFWVSSCAYDSAGGRTGMSTLFLIHLFSPLSLRFSLHTGILTQFYEIFYSIYMHIISAPSSSAWSVLLCLMVFYWFIYLLQYETKSRIHASQCDRGVCIIVACAHFYWLFCGLFLFFLFFFSSSFLYRIALIASHCGFSVIFLHICVCLGVSCDFLSFYQNVKFSVILPKV